jgi:hypothetical protein
MTQDIDERRKQQLKDHCLGYHPASERVVYSLKIPQQAIDLLRRFVRFEPDDPQGYDCYKVEYSEVGRLLELLGQNNKQPEMLDYSSNLGDVRSICRETHCGTVEGLPCGRI